MCGFPVLSQKICSSHGQIHISRGGAVWQLVWLITKRSGVQIPLPQPRFGTTLTEPLLLRAVVGICDCPIFYGKNRVTPCDYLSVLSAGQKIAQVALYVTPLMQPNKKSCRPFPVSTFLPRIAWIFNRHTTRPTKKPSDLTVWGLFFFL